MNSPGELLVELDRARFTKWTHSDEILALILERLDALYNLTEFVWSDPKKRPTRMPKPFRYRRPAAPKPKPSTLSEIRRFFTGR